MRDNGLLENKFYGIVLFPFKLQFLKTALVVRQELV